MFTGIIRELGTVARVEGADGVARLSIRAPETASLARRLDSIAVNGVCLSVVSVRGATITCDLIAETRRLTTLGRLARGARVNLEPSLSLADRLGGHVVFGHVDGLGTVVARRQRGGERVLEIRVPATLRAWFIPKGPVAVDGVSLTLGSALTESTVRVHLIPETLRQTTLGERRVGDRVNLEVDYLAKLVQRFVQAPPGRVTRQGRGRRARASG